jgi:hypothetical protein
MEIIEHGTIALSGTRQFADVIETLTIGLPLEVFEDDMEVGGYIFLTKDGDIVGKITNRQKVAQALNDGATVLHATVNSVSTSNLNNASPSVRVRVVTGPHGATWTMPLLEPRGYYVAVVGERSYQAAIAKCMVGDLVDLFHERDNPFDSRALAVVTKNGTKIGYIGRDSWVHRVLLDEERGCSANISSIDGNGEFWGVVIELRLTGEPIGELSYSG